MKQFSFLHKCCAALSVVMLLILSAMPQVALADSVTVGNATVSHEVTDLNGGNYEIGDTLRYTVTIVNNNPTEHISQPQARVIIPFGTSYVDGSIQFVQGGDPADTLEVVPNPRGHDQVRYATIQIDGGVTVEFQYDVVVEGSPLYLVDNTNSTPDLYEVNKATGATTLVTSMTGYTSTVGLALSDDARYVYGVDNSTDTLYYYDVQKDQIVDVGPLNVGNISVPCLDFDANNKLYAADARADDLYQVDTETGQATLATSLGVDIRGGDCAFASDGRLYVMSNTNNGKGALWVTNAIDGAAVEVADVSNTEFFTGLALDVESGLFASGTTTDSLWNVSPDTGIGTSIGSFGTAHGGGDLAMTAGQRLRVVSNLGYTDKDGLNGSDVVEIVIEGDAPVIGGGGSVDGGSEPVEPGTQDCVIDATPDECDFEDNFTTYMAYFIQQSVDFHVSQMEFEMSEEASSRELTGDELSTFFGQGYSILQSAESTMTSDANAMVTAFINSYQGQPGECPHEHGLMIQIRDMMTRVQADAEVDLHLIGDAGVATCEIVAQDPVIRYGDVIALGWDMANAGSGGTIDQGIGSVGTIGTTAVQPSTDTTYTLTTSSGVTCSVTVQVLPACSIGTPNRFPVEQSAGTQLIWNGTGHNVVEITGLGGVSITGSQSVFPQSTTTYVMTGYQNGQATSTCDVTVEVVADEELPTCPGAEAETGGEGAGGGGEGTGGGADTDGGTTDGDGGLAQGVDLDGGSDGGDTADGGTDDGGIAEGV